MSEADIHFELYRHLQNAIEEEPDRDGITFGTARPEYGESIDGFADIVISTTAVRPCLSSKPKSPVNRGTEI